jgi:radical SAM-linked protein
VHPRSEPPERAPDHGTNGAREAVQRWRLVVSRAAQSGQEPQGDQLAEWEAALAAADLPIAGMDAARPKARFAVAAPLSVGIAGERELADLWLVERWPRWRVREALATSLPAGCALVELYDVWLGEPPLPGQVAASVYRAEIPGPASSDRLAAAATTLMASRSLPRERRRGERIVSYDLRPFLVSIEVTPSALGGALIRMTLRHDPAKGVGRPDETLAALGEVLGGATLTPTTVVRERVVLADQPPEPATRSPRAPSSGRRAAGPQGPLPQPGHR